ncbi:MAG: hypothetical protein KKE05_03610 [Nanoarchaeota archaeon]|nr:hypothetical protein [Nanoarchaeota archaeon]
MTGTEIYTAQEHILMGDTVPAKYLAQPHKPLGVIDGTITVEECDGPRQMPINVRYCFFGNYGGWGEARIFPLNRDRSS